MGPWVPNSNQQTNSDPPQVRNLRRFLDVMDGTAGRHRVALMSRAISGTAPFFSTLAACLSLIVIHWVLSYFTEASPTLSALTKGHATILIKGASTARRCEMRICRPTTWPKTCANRPLSARAR